MEEAVLENGHRDIFIMENLDNITEDDGIILVNYKGISYDIISFSISFQHEWMPNNVYTMYETCLFDLLYLILALKTFYFNSIMTSSATLN